MGRIHRRLESRREIAPLEIMGEEGGGEEIARAMQGQLEARHAGEPDLLAHYLERRDLPAALAATMDSTHAVFLASVGHEEMALVAALDRLAYPPKVTRIERLS